MTAFDAKKVAEELKWLKDHPHFEQRPASILDFLGEGYLDIDAKVRPGIKKALIDIFGEKVDGHRISIVRRAMLTGAIGIGKTTFASIALPYMVHWVLCLKSPQDFFGLLPGSRIAFMQMSTSEDQAADVVFGDIKARIQNAQWFVDNYQFDPKFSKEMHFPKDIWVLPGDSMETTFEGYNILGGIVDEADSHKVTATKDYGEDGYNAIHARIDSRFEGRGLLIIIGQMKKENGFAARKYKELLDDPEAHVVRMTIWDSRGWSYYPAKDDGTRDSFFYDCRRKMIIPSGVAVIITNPDILEIPITYQRTFQNNPERALRDLAGIPPATGDPFISLSYRIEEARDRWLLRYQNIGSPVDESCTTPKLEPWFQARESLKRVMHVDLAYSENGDAAGLAMGHVRELVIIDGEEKPYIIIDCLVRLKAPPGGEIIFGDIRRLIYYIKEVRKFKLRRVTLDGFQSQDTIQQLRKKRLEADYLSIDKSKLPYEDLREAIYEGRIEFPKYITHMKPGDHKTVEIAYAELSQLSDNGKKIDHPVGGSKDVADAMAGVVYTLMGDRQYHRGVLSYNAGSQESVQQGSGTSPSFDMRVEGLRAPIPETGIAGLAVPVPMHLRPRRDR
jgi:hypothetical protein